MILVTGSTGMIGRALVQRFSREGAAVRAHGRSQLAVRDILQSINGSGQSEIQIESAVCDLSSMSASDADDLCKGCSVVIHAASLVHQPHADPGLYDSCNVRGTKLLCDAAARSGVQQFIFLSSTSVYGNRATNMIDEQSPLSGDTPYAASKIASEEYLQSNPPAKSTVILRPSLVFGEGDRGNMIALIKQILSGRYFLVGDGSASKSLIYSHDLADAINMLVKEPPSGVSIFNIANPMPVSIKTLSESILSAAGKKPCLISLPSWFIRSAAAVANPILGKRSPLSADRLSKLIRDNSVSVSAFTNRFQFEPAHDLASALTNEVAWARQERML